VWLSCASCFIEFQWPVLSRQALSMYTPYIAWRDCEWLSAADSYKARGHHGICMVPSQGYFFSNRLMVGWCKSPITVSFISWHVMWLSKGW
jgi:hypothetical protein